VTESVCLFLRWQFADALLSELKRLRGVYLFLLFDLVLLVLEDDFCFVSYSA
jgi:hypothetical protein